jgi:regulation of enolase protein 1 (concanavalin A-like superfamily)
MQLQPLPMALDWLVVPADWSIEPDGSLRIAAGPRTDLFVPPDDRPATRNAPLFAGSVQGDFQLAARVTADLRSTFDAGALVLFAADDAWVKLALERSPQGGATIVSVVTRGVSDDCNSWIADGGCAWLRIARIGATCALHASDDGARWDLVRHFAFEAPDGLTAGFSAQSPTGDGCTATFDDVRFVARTLAELRDGS